MMINKLNNINNYERRIQLKNNNAYSNIKPDIVAFSGKKAAGESFRSKAAKFLLNLISPIPEKGHLKYSKIPQNIMDLGKGLKKLADEGKFNYVSTQKLMLSTFPDINVSLHDKMDNTTGAIAVFHPMVSFGWRCGDIYMDFDNINNNNAAEVAKNIYIFTHEFTHALQNFSDTEDSMELIRKAGFDGVNVDPDSSQVFQHITAANLPLSEEVPEFFTGLNEETFLKYYKCKDKEELNSKLEKTYIETLDKYNVKTDTEKLYYTKFLSNEMSHESQAYRASADVYKYCILGDMKDDVHHVFDLAAMQYAKMAEFLQNKLTELQ